MNTLRTEDIRHRLLVARLPSPPQTLLKLLSLCQSDEADIAELTTLIAHDPAMATKVLAVAHSAAYHRSDASPLTLLQATSRLGTALIKVLVISESVAQTFNSMKPSGTSDRREFWKHSLYVALISRELARHLDYAQVEEAYLAGLLHDVGRLALQTAVPERYATLSERLDDSALCRDEHRRTTLSHAEAGAWLLGHWRLSEQLVESVLLHHEIDSRLTQAQPLTRLIHLAHRLAALPMGEQDDTSGLVGEQGLSADNLISITRHAATQVEQVARDLDIDISAAAAQPRQMAKPIDTDPVQIQLAQEVHDRSVLNEMAMTLIAQNSSEEALTQLRCYASALLKLDDVLVMLLRNNQHQLVPVSMNDSHRAAALLSYEVSSNALFAECVTKRKVVFSGPDNTCALALQDIMTADGIVLIPLLSAQQCLGVLVAAVPAALSQHLKRQTTSLQTFGVYAGLAMSRRRQASLSPTAQTVLAKHERQLGFKKLAQEISKQNMGCTSVDLCFVVSSVLQQLEYNNLVPANVKLSCQLADRACWVRCSLAAIQQALLILIKNTLDKLPNGGTLVIEAGALAHRHGSMYTALTLSDSAPSTVHTVQAQLFEPPHIFHASDATGLMMYDMNRLIEKNAGHLNFTTSPRGTRFDVLLPCASPMQLVA